MIKTASWWTTLPADHIKICISRGVPCRMPAGYGLYKRLAPSAWSNSVPTEEYLHRYHSEILAPLDQREVHDRILALASGKVAVLCCFERAGSGQWCHRALAAAWLAEAMGEVVPEFGHEQLAQDRHPLLPQELLV